MTGTKARRHEGTKGIRRTPLRASVPSSLRPFSAFTLVELLMGMVVTSMVLGALAAFTAAMGQSWTAADSPQSLPVTQAVVTARLQDIFRNAKSVGVVLPGSLDTSSTQTAGVMLWLNDDLVKDGKIQWGEAGWLEYDPSLRTLRLYQLVNNPTNMQKLYAKQLLSSSNLNSGSTPGIFKAKNFVTKISNPSQQPRLMATNVVAAQFASRDPADIAGRPSVEFTIILDQNGRQEVSYGNAALRNASTPAN